jgi:hypothetical protein
MSIYSPLRDRLANAGSRPVTLTFEEIERLLGRSLPPSARDERIKRQWWANTGAHAQARAWLAAGRKARLDARNNRVTFIQDSSGEATLRIDDEALTPAARQLVRETAREWGDDCSAAAAALLNEAARQKRLAILEEMDRLRARTIYSDVSSVDLIREDRDAR